MLFDLLLGLWLVGSGDSEPRCFGILIYTSTGRQGEMVGLFQGHECLEARLLMILDLNN